MFRNDKRESSCTILDNYGKQKQLSKIVVETTLIKICSNPELNGYVNENFVGGDLQAFQQNLQV